MTSPLLLSLSGLFSHDITWINYVFIYKEAVVVVLNLKGLKLFKRNLGKYRLNYLLTFLK